MEETMKRATSALANAWKVPTLSSVRFEGVNLSSDADDNRKLKGAFSLKSTWTQSTVASCTKTSFSRTDFCVYNDALNDSKGEENMKLMSGPTMPSTTDPESSISDYSSEHQLEITIRKKMKVGSNKDESQFVLEIWKPTNMVKSINLSEINAHGDVYMDGELGSVAINRQGTKVAYIAEEKRQKSDSFFKGYGAKLLESSKDSLEPEKKDVTTKGQEYKYIEDFGEQLVGKHQTVIVILDLESDELRVLPRKKNCSDNEGVLPFDVSPGLILWDDNGKSLYGISTFTEPRRLGLIYCSNRRSCVFKICLGSGKYFELSSQRTGVQSENISCRSPRMVVFNEEKKYLIWTERDLSQPNYPGPHQSCFRLMKMNMVGKNKPEIVIDLINGFDPEKDDFAGLYMPKIGKNCIVAEDLIILTTVVNDTLFPVICNLVSGEFQVMSTTGRHLTVHDSFFDPIQKTSIVVGTKSTPLQPSHLVIGKLERDESSTMHLSCSTIGDIVQLDGLSLEADKYTWRTLNHTPKHVIKGYENVRYSSIFIGPTTTIDGNKVPLILWPHGGPHSVIATSFMQDVYYFLMLGYSILFVNYRGSLGAGNDSVLSLPGNVGDSDVKDCYQALQECLSTFENIDSDRVCLFGGSHGGFLVTHLAGQYPDAFKAVVARNPVVDITSMGSITDIPDWDFNEGGFPFDFSSNIFKNPEVASKMYSASPVAHAENVKAPVFLMIGKNDLRVPPSQGYEFYHMLKAMNKDVRMNIYDDCHPLSKESVHSNVMINTAMFYNEASMK